MIPALPLSREHPQDTLQFLTLRSVIDQNERLFAREFEQLAIPQGTRDMKAQFAGLSRAKELSGAAKLQIGFRNLKAMRSAHHGIEPGAGFVGHSKRRHQNAVRLLRAAPDAPAKLMQLREAKSLGMLECHGDGDRACGAIWPRAIASASRAHRARRAKVALHFGGAVSNDRRSPRPARYHGAHFEWL